MAALNRWSVPALLAGGLLISSATALAQNSTPATSGEPAGLTANTVDPVYDATSSKTETSITNATQVVPVGEERDRDFPWGLLGLLGLAGLLGRKKRDDIHVDARHDRRNV